MDNLELIKQKIRDTFKNVNPELAQYPNSYIKVGLDSAGQLKAILVHDGKETDAIVINAWQGDIIIQGLPIIEINNAVQRKSKSERDTILAKMIKGFAR